jgi:hypothetical protein
LEVPVQGRLPDCTIAATRKPVDGAKDILRPPNPFRVAKRPWLETRHFRVDQAAMEKTMKRTLIRYKTGPESADENAALVRAVFAELKAAKPEDVRYLTLRLEDDNFVHFVETTADDGSSALPKLAAFEAFQRGIRERCAEPPVRGGVSIVGNYRMLDER